MEPSLSPISGAVRVVPRSEHGVSRAGISNNALRVLYRLKDAGYQAFLVGGAVRDLLLGLKPKDFDIATDATPEQIARLFRNCRLIGRRFRLAHVHFGQEIIEVATFRGDDDDGSGGRRLEEGRIVRDNVYGSIDQDAVRRDFSVNALYYNIADFSIWDYVGGLPDLQQRLLRLIGDPEARYREDPVRMLRGARLAAKLELRLHPDCVAPIIPLRGLLADVPSARLFDEALKMFLGGHGEASYRSLLEYGLFEPLFPGTSKVLGGNDGARVDRLLTRALVNTDQRVRDGRPVTPAFLFAVLLWPALIRELGVDRADPGLMALDAQEISEHADLVVLEATARVALPRRFALPMREIWMMQPRFLQRHVKRAQRFMGQPRFRAAYDFFLLRAGVEPELQELADWWTELMVDSPQAPPAAPSRRRAGAPPTVDAALDPDLSDAEASSDDGTDDDATVAELKPDAPKRKRRRRRKPSAPTNGSSND